MRDESKEHHGGFLTEKQREYLRFELQNENPNNVRQIRHNLRNKVRDAIGDFYYLHYLEHRDREQIFGGLAESSDEEHGEYEARLAYDLVSLFDFFFTSLGPQATTYIENGIKASVLTSAIDNFGLIPDADAINVSVDLDLEWGENATHLADASREELIEAITDHPEHIADILEVAMAKGLIEFDEEFEAELIAAMEDQHELGDSA